MPATRSSSTARPTSSRLLPSGIVREGKLSVIGNGVVVDPHHLVEEIAKLERPGRCRSTPANLKIAENVTLILERCIASSTRTAKSNANSGTKIGTTKRGIGPAYEDKVGRRAVRLMDLAEPEPRWMRRSSGCSLTTTRCDGVSASSRVSPSRRSGPN